MTTLFKSTISFIVRYYDYGSAIHSFNWSSWVYVALEQIVFILVHLPNYFFVFAGFIDF